MYMATSVFEILVMPHRKSTVPADRNIADVCNSCSMYARSSEPYVLTCYYRVCRTAHLTRTSILIPLTTLEHAREGRVTCVCLYTRHCQIESKVTKVLRI